MAINTTALKYGWKVLAILTIGTGTIFVVPNVLNRITTKDRIEITLAVVERCLATQTGTNPATYGVAPPVIVRTWTDTNGASISMTNALEWRDDLSMKVAIDAKIKALCPLYVNTNSVYDGTTNIIMHTFTGLLASLNIGDGTNFTAIPAIGTNPATYGPWAWRNYIVAWQERYKVLNALKKRFLREYVSDGTNFDGFTSPLYNQAIYRGSGDGATNNGHLYHGTDSLGLADNTGNTILIDLRAIKQTPGFDYITLGNGSGRYPSYGASLSFFLDRDESQTNPATRTFTAQLNLSASPNIVGIYNVICVEQSPEGSPSITYTRSSVNVAATLRKSPGGVDWSAAGFVFFPILTFPFQYCTNKFW